MIDINTNPVNWQGDEGEDGGGKTYSFIPFSSLFNWAVPGLKLTRARRGPGIEKKKEWLSMTNTTPFVAAIDVGALYNLGFWWNDYEIYAAKLRDEFYGRREEGFSHKIGRLKNRLAKMPLTEQERKDLNLAKAEKLIETIIHASTEKRPIAIGFECPLWIPVTNDLGLYNSSRPADVPLAKNLKPDYVYFENGASVTKTDLPRAPNRPWSAGAGASAGLTGLAFITSFLARLMEEFESQNETPGIVTTPEKWLPGSILLWEAFISGKAHPGDDDKNNFLQHDHDARNAWESFNILHPQWAGRGGRIPGFFLELSHNPRRFACLQTEASPPKFISFIEVACRSVQWPRYCEGPDSSSPPLIIRANKRKY